VSGPPVTYYARLGPQDTVERPGVLLRRVREAGSATDEALRHNGEWRPTDILLRADRGELTDRIVEVPAEHATELAQQWRAAAERLERDLAAQGRGELGLRVARAVDVERDERGTPIIIDPPLDEFERIAIAMYLKKAPVVVASWGFDLDPFDPVHPEAVPQNIHTDGLWVWSESLAYFATVHGIRPEPELVEHMKAREYRVPEVQRDVLLRAARLARG
jgi:hypothetical protein